MGNKITGYGQGGVDVGAAQGTRSTRPERAAGEPPVRESGSHDSVRLTGAAAQLQQLEARLARLPDVDTARVEAVRARIDSGEYRMDAGRVADRLLRLERSL